MWKIWLLWIHPPLIVILAWEDHMGKQQSVHKNKVLTWIITNGQRNKGEIWNLAFIFIFLIIFFYTEWTSVKLKILFICCLYMPLVSWHSAYYVCRSANDSRSTSRRCNTSWVWLLWMYRQHFQDDQCSQMCE